MDVHDIKVLEEDDDEIIIERVNFPNVRCNYCSWPGKQGSKLFYCSTLH